MDIIKKFGRAAVHLFLIMTSSLSLYWSNSLHAQSANTVNHDPMYFQIPASPISYLTDGTILAMAHDADGKILGCALYDGELPPGIALTDDGTLIVTSQEKLIIGTHPLEIFTVDEKGGISAVQLTLSFLAKGLPDVPSQAHIPPLKPLHLYKQHDVLAQVWDLDGPIVRTQFVKGELPHGTYLTEQGKIMIENPQTLKPATYNFILLVEDQKGGASFMALTLPLSTRETANRP